ncbi:hypothetical protein RHSP_41703 (plasmid) [Rhizobium freirei PRF 81]|uniref:Uncharacterized protein n=1 Tax=Rhizobium freirei PRF 81 TaxID=363754 RepID=N6U0E3_9HYPH|nr:hypothetical protein RHSP_41703 [Rhizobium freirei PRF 81]
MQRSRRNLCPWHSKDRNRPQRLRRGHRLPGRYGPWRCSPSIPSPAGGRRRLGCCRRPCMCRRRESQRLPSIRHRGRERQADSCRSPLTSPRKSRERFRDCGPWSAPLHFTGGDLGTDVDRDFHGKAREARLHCRVQFSAGFGLGELFFEGEQVGAGMLDPRNVGCCIRNGVAGDHDGRFAGDNCIQHLDPSGAAFLRRGISGPDMCAIEDQHATEYGLKRRNPEIAAVVQSVGLDDLDHLTIDGQGRFIIGGREDDVVEFLRAIFLELRTPGVELLLHICLDRLDGGAGSDDAGVGEGFDHGTQAEVIVWIGLADIDRGQFLAICLDRFGKRLAIWQGEATVDQHGFRRAGNKNGSAKEAVRASREVRPA